MILHFWMKVKFKPKSAHPPPCTVHLALRRDTELFLVDRNPGLPLPREGVGGVVAHAVPQPQNGRLTCGHSPGCHSSL